jgi:LmbE family N-acetylglucosaminyl deacetylase
MLHVLCIGAHPDDCEFHCGGLAVLLSRRGGRVKFVSVTNGDRGHFDERYLHDRHALAARRREESRAAVGVFGGESECLGVPDGEVYVTKELTERVVRVMRGWGEPGRGPDLVLLNRPNDYHRDHRYTAQVVLDAVYMLKVPLMCADVPALERMPVLAYWLDRFREGAGAFRPDVVVPIDSAMEEKARMAAAHESQMFEWLPWVRGERDFRIGDGPEARVEYARKMMEGRGRMELEACLRDAPQLVPAGCRFVEAYQISEYGEQVGREELMGLFPVEEVV